MYVYSTWHVLHVRHVSTVVVFVLLTVKIEFWNERCCVSSGAIQDVHVCVYILHVHMYVMWYVCVHTHTTHTCGTWYTHKYTHKYKFSNFAFALTPGLIKVSIIGCPRVYNSVSLPSSLFSLLSPVLPSSINCSTPVGRITLPNFGAQVNNRTPFTSPSFRPHASSISTPNQ